MSPPALPDVVRFPAGLPGFETETGFRLVVQQDAAPAILLESLATPHLFFVTIPVQAVEPGYELKLLEEYRKLLNMDSGDASGLLALAIVCFSPGGQPTVNLAAPVVVSLTDALGVQAIRDDARYSARHPLMLTPEAGDAPCS
jgi:flagellar assembly factor FliW